MIRINFNDFDEPFTFSMPIGTKFLYREDKWVFLKYEDDPNKLGIFEIRDNKLVDLPEGTIKFISNCFTYTPLDIKTCKSIVFILTEYYLLYNFACFLINCRKDQIPMSRIQEGLEFSTYREKMEFVNRLLMEFIKKGD